MFPLDKGTRMLGAGALRLGGDVEMIVSPRDVIGANFWVHKVFQEDSMRVCVKDYTIE